MLRDAQVFVNTPKSLFILVNMSQTSNWIEAYDWEDLIQKTFQATILVLDSKVES